MVCEHAEVGTDPLTAVRDIALAFPEATEVEAWGNVTFRVADAVFVTFGDTGDDRVGITVHAAPGGAERAVRDGDPYFAPPYATDGDRIGLHLDADTDWRLVGELVTDSYREVAPRHLAVEVGLRPGGRSMTSQMIVGVGNVIGELVEGKPPKDQTVAEEVAPDDHDDGLRIDFDPDDPSGSTIQL